MKFNVGILIAIQAVGAFSSAVVRDAEAECSNLGGVMLLDNLPAEVDVGAVRQCVDGPSGSSETSELEKRECWYGKDVGCSKSGYCYKKCGEKNSGTWCWTARNNGFGDWYTCSKDSECKSSMACGQAIDGCKDCGCSC